MIAESHRPERLSITWWFLAPGCRNIDLLKPQLLNWSFHVLRAIDGQEALYPRRIAGRLLWWIFILTFSSLCHYYANHLTSTTFCSSYLTNDVYLLSCVQPYNYLPSPHSQLQAVNVFIQGTVQHGFYLLCVLYKPCAFQFLITLQLCSTVKRTTSS